jgi:hypothetical protein
LPYKKDQVVIFKSKQGEVDSIKIDSLFKMEGDINMYNPFANKYEEIEVSVHHSKDTYPINFIQLTKSRDKHARLQIQFLPGNSWFYSMNGDRIDSLIKLKGKKIKIGVNTFNDVCFLYPQDIFNRTSENNFVTKVYFSKKYGIIKFDRQDGNYWELKE